MKRISRAHLCTAIGTAAVLAAVLPWAAVLWAALVRVPRPDGTLAGLIFWSILWFVVANFVFEYRRCRERERKACR